jgi:hypothetical protein
MPNRSKLMKRAVIAFLLGAVFLSAAEVADARDYFVRTSGDDNNDGRKARNAFKTLKRAAQIASREDTIYVGGGTHTAGSVWWRGSVEIVGDPTGRYTGDRGTVRINSPSNQWTMGFHQTAGAKPKISNMLFTGVYGVYTYNVALTTTSCQFVGNSYGLYAYRAANRVKKSTFSSRTYGILSYYGNTYVDGCNFTSGNYGLYSVQENKLEVKNSTFTKNTGWPLLLLGTGWKVSNCTISDNNYGVYMANLSNKDLNFKKTTIENNRYYGAYFYACNIVLDKRTMEKIPTKNNGYGYAFNNCTAAIRDVTITGHKYYGVLSWYGTIDIANTAITSNGNGLYLYENKRSTITNTKIEKNSSWGLMVYQQPFQMTNSYVQNNNYGAFLYKLSNAQVNLSNARISNNKYYGMYAYYCNLSFSPAQNAWGIKDNGYGIYAYQSTIRCNKFDMSGHSGYAFSSYKSDVIMDGCKFDNNGSALSFNTNTRTVVNNCTIRNNTEWGLANYTSPITIKNTPITGNGYGAYFYKNTDAQVAMSGSPIRDSKYMGLYANTCKFEFTPSTASKWVMSNNGYGIYAWYSDLVIKDRKFTGSKYYALLTYYGSLHVENSEFTQNGVGIQAYRNNAVLKNVSSHHNISWGITAYEPKSIENVKVDSNAYGLYLWRPKGDLSSLKNASLTNNKYYGLYITEGKVRFTNDSTSNVKLANNGYGIVGWRSDLTLDGVDLTGSRYYGILSYYGKLSINNSRLYNNGSSVYSYYSDTVINKSQIYENTGWGVLSYGNTLAMDRTEVRDNNYGLYLYKMNDSTLKFTNSVIKDNEYHGMYAGECNLKFDNSTKADYRLSNNGYGITGYKSNLEFDDWTIEKSAYYGLLSYYSNIRMKNSIVRENGNGIYAYQNTSTVLEDCDVHSNESWAFQSYYKPVELTRTKIRDNRYGVYLYGVDDAKVKFSDSEIYNTTYYGVYVNQSKLTFSKDTKDKWQTYNNGYGFCSVSSTVTFDKWPIKGSKYFGLLSYYSYLTVKNSDISGNGNGLYLYDNKNVEVSNTKIHGNTGWGVLSYYAGWKFKDVDIYNNTYGMHAHTVTDDKIQMAGTSIRDNKYYGFHPYNSTISFVGDDGKWSIKNNGYGIYGSHCNLTFDNFDVTGCKYYGVMSTYGTLNMKDSDIANNGNGLYLYKNTSVNVADSKIHGNTSWGVLSYYGGWDFKNVDIYENNYGMHAHTVTDEQIKMAGSSIRDNKYHGFHPVNSTIKFAANDGRWAIKNNGYGILAMTCNITFDGFEVSGCKYYGILSYYGNLAMKNTNIEGNGNGLYLYQNKSVTVADTKIHGNTGWGVLSYFAGWDFKNVDVYENNNGMHAHTVSDGQIKMTGTSIRDNTYHGFYPYKSTITFSKDGRWSLKNNGYGIVSNSCNLTFDGFDVSGNKFYGILSYYDTLSIKDTNIEQNGNGLYLYHPTSVVVSDTKIHHNTGWGVLSYGPNWQFANTEVYNNNYGFYMNGVKDNEIKLANVSIHDNKYHGVYGHTCEMYFNKANYNQSGSRWQLKNNGYGIVGYNSDMKVEAITVENSKYIGVLSYYGDLLVRDATIRNSGHGLYLYRNKNVTVDRARIYNNTGWAVLKYGGDLSMRNSVVTRNNVGVYLYGYADTDISNVWNTTIADNGAHGIYQANRGQGSLVNNVISNTKRSGYGIYTANKISHSHNLVHGFNVNYGNTSASSDDVVEDPKFFDRANGNYALNGFSPAVNRGTKMAGKVDADIVGAPRPAYGRWELGAYEYTKKTAQVRVTSWSEER